MTAIDEKKLASAPDEQLAARASEDYAAATELYSRYLCSIYRFIRSQTPNDQVAEDLTAHVFFMAFSRAQTFRSEGAYRAWLYRIARNCLSSWRRDSGRCVAVEELPEEADEQPSPAARVISLEERSFIWDTVAKLPPAQREVVTLHYLQDLSIGEVAKITRRTTGAIRVLLHRARTKLRGLIERRQKRDGEAR